MRSKVSVGEYLALLSMKHEVDPDKLFYALVSAWKNEISTCGDLSIKCRGKLKDRVVLLITKGPKVVAQFPITKEFLLEPSSPIRNLRKDDILRRQLFKREKGPHTVRIRDLRTGMRQVNLKAKVLEIARPTVVFRGFEYSASVANALIADETGTIKLCLWNKQIDSVSVGDTVQIENAHVSMFRGERQLRIGKNGMLNIVEETNSTRESA